MVQAPSLYPSLVMDTGVDGWQDIIHRTRVRVITGVNSFKHSHII